MTQALYAHKNNKRKKSNVINRTSRLGTLDYLSNLARLEGNNDFIAIRNVNVDCGTQWQSTYLNYQLSFPGTKCLLSLFFSR
jgi:hypothetical protein